MQQIYGNVTKVLVDSRSGSNLLYLPLDKIMQQTQSGVEPAAASSSNAPINAPLPPGSSSTDSRSRDASRSRERDSR
jgi:membrane protease subunit HflK